MIRTPLLCLCILANTYVFGQFSYDFNLFDDLASSTWEGAIDNFIVNENGELQLMAPDAGNSFIYHKTNIPDSTEWGLSFKMDFSPSENNKLRIYLFLNKPDLETASGYYLEIGENGSEDKISFVRMIDGEGLTLAEGTPGDFTVAPSVGSLRINNNGNGIWSLSIKNAQSGFYEEEFEIFDSTIKEHFDQYFGLHCFYTSSRRDKFYFDDIYLQETIADTIAPKLLYSELLSENELLLTFDEILNKESAINKLNYLVDGNIGHPDSVIFNNYKANQVKLFFLGEFSGNQIYNMAVSDLEDLSFNRVSEIIFSEFYLTEEPEKGDLIINEILFNPHESGSDFVELYNYSNKIIDLDGLLIDNHNKENSEELIDGEYHLFPGNYLAICEDTFSLHDSYYLIDTARLMEMPLPSFNNDEGNVRLIYQHNEKMITLDSFDYNEDMHFELVDDMDGLSLERISFKLDSNDPMNWQSAGSLYGGASPGFKNTQAIDSINGSQKLFGIVDKVFSPDNDGYQDHLLINYKLPKDAYVISISIFNSNAYFIKTLVNNQLLGTEGLIVWDGLNEQGQANLIGPYIIYIHGFHPDGDTISQKLVAYIAEKI